jgi:glycosyltransferase involved in cell wall biosynthesis
MITYLRAGPDGGQSAAIKKGEEAIPGDVVAWLNADDYYFPETFEKVASCFESDPELDVVYGDAVHVTPEGFFLSYFPSVQVYNPKTLTRRCFICQPACFVRRTAYERVGGINPALRYTMDWDLWCRLSMSDARFQYIHEPLAAVRYYPGTKTLSSDGLRYREIWRIERKYGHRPFPLSWPGFYRFDLSFKKEKNSFEELALRTFESLWKIRQRRIAQKPLADGLSLPIYGFDRFETWVARKCSIHLPWYGRQAWESLHLKVIPLDRSCRVAVNGKACLCEASDKNRLVVHLPHVRGPHITISVEQGKDASPWKLEAFVVDFDEGSG